MSDEYTPSMGLIRYVWGHGEADRNSAHQDVRKNFEAFDRALEAEVARRVADATTQTLKDAADRVSDQNKPGDVEWESGFQAPVEPEWEYGVMFPEIRREASFVGIEDSARYFMGRPANSLDKYARDDDKRVLVRRVPAGPWIPVEGTRGGDGA